MVSQEKMEQIKGNVSKTLATMLDYLGLEASLKVEEKGSRLAVLISSEEAGRIIGRKGQTLEGLQLLLNRMMFNADTDCPKISLDIDGYSRKGGKPHGDNDGVAVENGEGHSERRRERSYDREPRRHENRPHGRREHSEHGERSESRPRQEHFEEDSQAHEENLQRQANDAAKEVKRWGEPVVLPKMNSHDRRIIHITLQEDTEITTASEGDGALKNVIISIKK